MIYVFDLKINPFGVSMLINMIDWQKMNSIEVRSILFAKPDCENLVYKRRAYLPDKCAEFRNKKLLGCVSVTLKIVSIESR